MAGYLVGGEQGVEGEAVGVTGDRLEGPRVEARTLQPGGEHAGPGCVARPASLGGELALFPLAEVQCRHGRAVVRERRVSP